MYSNLSETSVVTVNHTDITDYFSAMALAVYTKAVKFCVLIVTLLDSLEFHFGESFGFPINRFV